MAPHARDTCRLGAGLLLPPSDKVHCLEAREVWLTGLSVQLSFIAQKNHAVSARGLLPQALNPVSTAPPRRKKSIRCRDQNRWAAVTAVPRHRIVFAPQVTPREFPDRGGMCFEARQKYAPPIAEFPQPRVGFRISLQRHFDEVVRRHSGPCIPQIQLQLVAAAGGRHLRGRFAQLTYTRTRAEQDFISRAPCADPPFHVIPPWREIWIPLRQQGAQDHAAEECGAAVRI